MIFAIFNVIRMVLGLVLARLSATRDHTATARSQVVLVMRIAEVCIARIAALRLRRATPPCTRSRELIPQVMTGALLSLTRALRPSPECHRAAGPARRQLTPPAAHEKPRCFA